ncbi:MAG TPA: hypothetical protein VMO47_04890, partial [Rhodothermales bacterium]|nr:hypothetical protein [Rhodothermales bacterium]
MKAGSIILLAAVVGLGSVILLTRGDDDERGSSEFSADTSRSASRDSIDAFWEFYRTASNLRRDGN